MNNDCSKCEEPAEHSILVRDEGEPPPPDQKDHRGVRNVRFCKVHWNELKSLIRDTRGT